jgi:Family of unknown function (DUF6152)
VRAGIAVALTLGAASAFAHHSYAMFDTSKSVVVRGSIAKVEWVNPHVFVWAYVEKLDQPGKYDLYGFETGPINMLTRNGWTKDALAAGEKVRIQYFPLKDGRPGGSFIKAIHADGRELIGDPFSPGVAEAAKSTPPEQQ